MPFKTKKLTPSEINIIQNKETEYPFTGEYESWTQPGTYLCKQCGLALFRSHSKFHSGCGWPSFDEEVNSNVKKQLDQDGHRMEIVCQRCEAHLGHVFGGEQFTEKNIRHCVNSASLDFVAHLNVKDTEEAIFAAGCFWGVEHLFKKLNGVLKTEVGYTGGHKENPTYDEVCSNSTGHLEAIRILFDPTLINYRELTKYFFEIHDPTQQNGQGPDIGPQYLSAIFYFNEQQKNIAEELISELKTKGQNVATKIKPITPFWRAEEYHQDYYAKTGKEPYCHFYQKRF